MVPVAPGLDNRAMGPDHNSVHPLRSTLNWVVHSKPGNFQLATRHGETDTALMKKKYLVISAIGQDRPGLVDSLSQTFLECGCNIEDSRMTVLGSEFAIVVLISGNWNNIAKLQEQLPQLAGQLDMLFNWKDTVPRPASESALPYLVEVVSIDHPGIVHTLSRFFSQRQINVEDLMTSSYAAPHTGAIMFSIRLTVGIPSQLHIAQLREEFFDLCDQHNLDAIIEPVRS